MSESNVRPMSSEDRTDLEPFDVDQDEPELDVGDVDAADAAEQRRLADSAEQRAYRRILPDDVDPADAADQYREVDIDEDDYR